jgi:hypothetical protein
MTDAVLREHAELVDTMRGTAHEIKPLKRGKKGCSPEESDWINTCCGVDNAGFADEVGLVLRMFSTALDMVGNMSCIYGHQGPDGNTSPPWEWCETQDEYRSYRTANVHCIEQMIAPLLIKKLQVMSSNRANARSHAQFLINQLAVRNGGEAQPYHPGQSVEPKEWKDPSETMPKL